MRIWWAALSSWFLARAARPYVPCQAFRWSCPILFPWLLCKPVPQKCHRGDGVKNKVWMLHSKLVPCFYRKKKVKKKSGWKNRIDLNIPHIIVKNEKTRDVSCSRNIVVCVSLLCNHIMPPVFTVKLDLLEFVSSLLSGDAKQCFIVE